MIILTLLPKIPAFELRPGSFSHIAIAINETDFLVKTEYHSP
ncbi:hypothetical protein H1P_3240014 [Hyella patelloides LEGE 07179]|uniref:Uncharacterized protein n=1 Tax=Hyella patelloides LEGE 07179 TaxID=945734 RepID=A0A563VV51_9CYAN|nr:hypothetical protein [Hyella patelloides]VEP15312.1 hypothetical protein H1P_3240014 [Hyella patelloides LEGE 07179]